MRTSLFYSSLKQKTKQYQIKSVNNVYLVSVPKDRVQIETMSKDIEKKIETYMNNCNSKKYDFNYEECNILWDDINTLAYNLYDLYEKYDICE